jgi:hypothetical protein
MGELLLKMPKHYHGRRSADARLDYNGGFDTKRYT